MNITFQPKIKTLGYFKDEYVITHEELRDETMFFTYDPVLAMDKAGPITKGILEKYLEVGIDWTQKDVPTMEDFGLHWVLDTRVTMTQIGQYPSIPGWHCDDVPRQSAMNGTQPEFRYCKEKVRHFLTLISSSPAHRRGESVGTPCVSGTEFVTSTHTYDIDTKKVWKSLHDQVEADDTKTVRRVNEREMVEFNQLAIHRATPCTRTGWRMFFRLSKTYRTPVNSIRNQVQIYVDPNNAGW